MFEIFYNKAVRKLTVAFGSLFNNIHVIRTDSSGTTTSQIRVPLGYGPKQKWIRRLNESSSLTDDTTDVEVTLPRLSFEMNSITYDPNRKKNTMQKRWYRHSENEKIYTNYVEVPYDFEFSVSVMVKFMEDGLCIMEQILPYFTPEFTITINFSDINQKVDIPIILNSVEVSEDYEGDFDARRLISFDMSFTAKTNLFGPTKTSAPIQTVTATIWEPESWYHDGVSLGMSGATAAMSKLTVGVTGPSGSSSGVDTFTGFTVGTRVYGMTGGDGIDIDGVNL
tara:strand:+ start:1487 stop:2329 length:843 start_codon:yes stop_codon:yes gene_type:complete